MTYRNKVLAGSKTHVSDGTDSSPELTLDDLESRFGQVQRMEILGRMATGVAHDFGRLLTIITGYNELALHSMASEHPLRDYLVEVGKAACQATRLTRQILSFSQVPAADTVALDLQPLVEDMQRMMRGVLGGDIDLIFVHSPGLGRVQVTPGHLDQVLLNLILNACDAMPHGGRITLVAENVFLKAKLLHSHGFVPAGSYVRLAISDTGCGMDERTRARIFELYSNKEPQRGTGLGMAIIQGIVRQNAGHIIVASEPGRGSTFAIYLPRLTTELAVPHAEISVA
jgi:signal transduction histidine kinase